MAHKLVIAAHKGGVGKTVTAITVSAALARSGKKTLLIDLDPQGHSGLGLGLVVEDGSPTLQSLFTDPPRPALELVRETQLPHLHILPSSIRLAWTAEGLAGRPKKEEILRRRLDGLEQRYEWIVMDCPPALGVLTQNAIVAADYVLVPALMEARAADALVDLIELMRLLRGDNFDDWGILLTRVDPRKSVTNEAVLAALEPWNRKIFKTRIPTNEPLNQAQIAGKDIFSFEPRSRGAECYLAFLEELINHGRKK